MKKTLVLLVCAALVLCALCGFSAEEGQTDMMGNELSFVPDAKAAIVSLTPSSTEIVCALGAEANLVGVDAFSNYPESVQQLEVVGDFSGPDVEKIVSLEPDLVLAGTTLQQDAIDALKGLGLEVVCTEATLFEDIVPSIELVGLLLEREAEAAEVVKSIDEAIAAAEQNAPQEEVTVYYAMSYGDMGNWTSGPGSFINAMIETAGGSCITDDPSFPAWVEYSLEDLVANDPDVILVDSSMGSAEDIAAANGYSGLSAVKEGRVYEITSDVFTRPGPRIADALHELSGILNEAA